MAPHPRPRARFSGGRGDTDGLIEFAADGIGQNADDLGRGFGDRHGGAVDLLQGMGQRRVMQGDDRLARGRGIAGVEGAVPLPVFVVSVRDL